MKPSDIMATHNIQPDAAKPVTPQVTAGAQQRQPKSKPAPQAQTNFNDPLDDVPSRPLTPVPTQVTAGAQQAPPVQRKPVTLQAPPGYALSADLDGLLDNYIIPPELNNILDEISVVYDPIKKPKNGCGFNWEGAPGKLGGTSISGGANTAKTDPTGKGKSG